MSNVYCLLLHLVVPFCINKKIAFVVMRPIYFLLLFVCICSVTVKAQNPFFAKLIEDYEAENKKTPKEIAYIHTDREFYQPGDKVAYTAYFLNQADSFEISKVGYVFLFDFSGRQILKQVVKIENRKASNTFLLPRDMEERPYYIVATTAWMQNFNYNFFRKKILIQQEKKEVRHNRPVKDVHVLCYPESGSFLPNLDQVVAVRALDNNGKGAVVNAIVKNKKGEELTSFSTSELGVGSFIVNTGQEKEIYVEYEQPAMKVIIRDTLVTNKNAANLTISNRKKLFIKVNTLATGTANYLLLGRKHGKISFKQEVTAKNIDEAFVIDKANLPSGINSILLVNKLGEIEAHRYIYINKEKETNVEIEINKNDTRATRRDIAIDFLATQKNINGSLSITNINDVDTNAFDIVAFMEIFYALGNWLDFPLAAFKDIENNPSLLEYILLTNGFMKPSGEKLVHETKIKLLPENGINLAGKITLPPKGTTVKDGKIDLIIEAPDSSKIFYSENANENGEFIIKNIPLNKGSKVYYSASTLSNLKKVTDVNFYPHFADNNQIPTIFIVGYNPHLVFEYNQASYKSLQKFKTLQEVTVRGTATSETTKMDKEYVSSLFENADQNLIVSNTTGMSLWQYLQQNINAMTVSNVNGETIAYFNRNTGLNLNGSVGYIQFYLNETPVSIAEFEAMSIEDIAYVKVFKGGSGYVLGVQSGAIAAYTRKGANFSNWKGKSFAKLDKTGYEPQYKYYNHIYSKATIDEVGEDIRSTLFWNGDFILNANQKRNVQISTDDTKGPWVLRLQGITANNEPIFEQRIIE
jgi:hypothetical protein